MKIGALAPWFGGKRTMAEVIIRELGEHSAYWEPFCGGMSVLLAKPQATTETVNDLHGDLINLARMVQGRDTGPALYRRLRRVVLHEHVLSESWAALASATDPLDRAFHYFVASWSGRNGFAGTKNVVGTKGIAVRYTTGGGQGGKRIGSAVESIPAWRRRMRRLVILSRDALDVIAKIDDAPRIAIYCDPPYLAKDADYQHDFTADTHTALAAALSRFKKTRVVVSYYAHPRLAELYPGWTVVDCAMNKGIHNAGKRGGTGKLAPEVLLINGPSLA